ncbi:MAG: hypothetical protein OEM02_16915 [Desulfobulbaceae bacterium]|nr:hypothetical protein [Desulfobulbaceae bacterium]
MGLKFLSETMQGMIEQNISLVNFPVFSGYCASCDKVHSLSGANAGRYGVALMRELSEIGRIDYKTDFHDADPRFSIQYLFGPARGQMFGVLECEDDYGSVHVLRAFSGQYNGVWEVDGWVGPLLDVAGFNAIVPEVDGEIKKLGRQIEQLVQGEQRNQLIAQRRTLSRNLMKEIHGLYRLPNFRYDERLLGEVFGGPIPTGTGDCCGPKLLNHAARNNLKPLSLAEFYWGKENRSGSKQHGSFYSSCKEKCGPIIGFMLCGIEDMEKNVR